MMNTLQIAMVWGKGIMTGLFQLASAILLLMSVNLVSAVCI